MSARLREATARQASRSAILPIGRWALDPFDFRSGQAVERWALKAGAVSPQIGMIDPNHKSLVFINEPDVA